MCGVFRGFLKKHGWKYLPGVVFLLLCSRLQTLLPLKLGEAIDLMEDGADYQALVHVCVVMVLLTLGMFATRFIWRMLIILNGRHMECCLREELFTHLQKLPVTFFARRRSGDLIAYSINDIGAVRQTFGPSLAMTLNSLATATLSVVSMAGSIDSRLTFLALLPIPFTLAGILFLRKLVRQRSDRVQSLFSDLSGFVNESIMGLRVLKTFVRESQWQKRHGDISDEMQTANEKLSFISAVTGPFITVCFGISYTIALIYGGRLVLDGAVSIGALAAFLSYLLMVQHPVTHLGRIVNSLEKGLASYRRLKAVMDEPETAAREYLPLSEADHGMTRLSGGVEARHLSYTYPGETRPALKDISFAIQPGQTLGIAGETGSGKSTLVSLLLKLQTPPAGALFFDGRDAAELSAAGIRDAVGYVPQDGFLFSASIRDNIRFYCPEATDEKVEQAARLADIHDEILAFPAGYDTQVGERGTHLSGGQKQRIALARALVRDPEILILDDTLSAVDNVTEQAILHELQTVLASRTAILVSHRLSALMHADLIVYLQDGQIAEAGTHGQLLAQNGLYARTWAQQTRRSGREEAAQ